MQTRIVLQYLQYLLAAATMGSFRQAAIDLNVWESTISRGIRDLEDEIGVTLFIRSSGGVKLTNAGKIFVGQIRIALSHIEYAIKDAGAAGRGEVGFIKVGIISSFSSGFFSNLVKSYQSENPMVQIDLIEGGAIDHIASIQHHQMDVAFVVGMPSSNECEITPLWEEHVFAVLPFGHVLSTYKELNWKSLRNEHFIVSCADPGPEIYDYIVKNLSELGYHPSIDRCSVSRDNLVRLVGFGRGLTLINEAATGAIFPDIIYRRIQDERLPFNAVWSRRNDNPAFRRFLSMAKSLAKKESSFSQKTNRSN